METQIKKIINFEKKSVKISDPANAAGEFIFMFDFIINMFLLYDLETNMQVKLYIYL
jgi:hypothetical protein